MAWRKNIRAHTTLCKKGGAKLAGAICCAMTASNVFDGRVVETVEASDKIEDRQLSSLTNEGLER